jgi:hypothetical protein
MLSTPKVKGVRYEVLTAVIMKSSIFWDITLYSSLKFNRRFGGTCRLHLLGLRIRLSTSFTLVSCLAYSSNLNIEAYFNNSS